METETFFWIISLSAALIILALGISNLVSPDLIFWPPPKKTSWQNKTFRWLFRAMIYPLIALSYLRFEPGNQTVIQLGSGGSLFLIGFGAAFASTFNLGWKTAFGDKNGLVTNGWFAYSRNPVYLVTWLGMIGWAVLIPDLQIWTSLLVWGMIYLLAIFLEERWLLKAYGNDFAHYKKKVPRFL